ncbi:MAG: PorT family protein [Bacteroidales bacterium]|jgi:hypothetical protein|nr:PorT family protein [Bacteroidales bacterium]
MSEKNIDRIIRKKLDGLNLKPSAGLWHSIESSLEEIPARGSGSLSGKPKHVFGHLYRYSAVAFAGICSVVLLMDISVRKKPVRNSDLSAYVMSGSGMNMCFHTAIAGERFTEPEAAIRDSKIRKETKDRQSYTPGTAPDNVAGTKTSGSDLTETKRERSTYENYSGSRGYMSDWKNNEIHRKKPAVSVSVMSNMMQGNSHSSSAENMILTMGSRGSGVTPGAPVIESTSDIKYFIPISLGVQAQVKLNSFLSVGIGLDYSVLVSKYDGLINKEPYKIRQTLSYLGVPVNAYLFLGKRKSVSFYANAGGSIEKGLRAEYRLKKYTGTVRHEHSSIQNFHYSLNAGIGVEYEIIPSLGIFFEPNLVYYINSDVNQSIRTDQPLQFNAKVGLRLHLPASGK